MKKSLALVLSVLMVLSCCTALFSFAASAEGLAFAWASVWFSPDNEGTWQESAAVPADELFDYDYTAAIVDGYLKIGVKYDGTITGTAEAFGNGKGTNFRIWLRNTNSTASGRDYHIDVAWNGSAWVAQMNTTVSGGQTYAYGATPEGFFTVAADTVSQGKGADLELSIALDTIGTPSAIDVIVSVSNNVNANYCLHSNNNGGAPASTWHPGSLRVTEGFVILNDIFGDESYAMDSSENSCWSDTQVPVDSNTASVKYSVDEKNLYIQTTYSGSLTHKDGAFGNGAGEFIRIWFYDPTLSATQEYNSYNSFVDIEAMVEGGVVPETPVRSRFLTNTKVGTANNASVTYAYDAEKPYTMSNTFDVENNIWVNILVMPLSVITTDPESFQFQPTVGFWGEHPTSPADSTPAVGYSSRTYGHNLAVYAAWDTSSALPEAKNLPALTDVTVPTVDTIDKNVSIGKNVTVSGIRGEYNGSNGAAMVDGNTASAITSYDKTAWCGLSSNSGEASVTIDLGENTYVSGVKVYTAHLNGASGIQAANSVKVLASYDGVYWADMGSMDVSALTTDYTSGTLVTLSLDYATYLNTRYVKVQVTGNWVFINEIEVIRTEQAYTSLIADINSYGWDGNAEIQGSAYAPILAYGEGKTIVELLGGNWFGWWTAVRATWVEEADAFVVSFVKNLNGSTEYTEWVLGENEVVFFFSNAGGEGAVGTEARAYVLNNLNVGDKLYIYGMSALSALSVKQVLTEEEGVIDSPYKVSFKAPLEGDDYLTVILVDPNPAGFTEVSIPAASLSENVALNCEFEDLFTPNASYKASLVDGVAKEEGGLAYDGTDPWKAYNKGTYTTIFDLGEIYDNLGNIELLVYPANNSGIVPPQSITYYASNDNIHWYELTSITQNEDPRLAANAYNDPIWVTTDFNYLVKARYIKMDVVTAGNFSFLGEIRINALTAIEAASLTNSYLYDSNAAILATWLMGDTLRDVNSAKSHGWWNFASAQWDSAQNAFVVREIIIAESNGSGDARDMVIPDYGFIIGGHASAGATAKALADFIAGLSVGDKLYVSGVDIPNVTAAGIVYEKAAVSTSNITGSYGFVANELLTVAGYAEDDVTVFIPFTDDEGNYYNTPTAIRNALKNAVKDYNYYAIMVVDSNNKVVSTHTTLGDTTHGAIEIPEGGFAIGAHGGATAISAAYVGDTVVLEGVDLEAMAGKCESLTGAYYCVIHTHNFVDKVTEPTCGAGGYTEHICVCGLALDITDITPATGLHTQEVTTVGFFNKYVCTVCGDSYATDLEGNRAEDLLISHHNANEWNAFEGCIISGGSMSSKNLTARAPGYKVDPVVINEVTYYIVSEFLGTAEATTAAVPSEGGFIMYFAPHAVGSALYNNGELLGKLLLLNNFDLAYGFAIDTSKNSPYHIYAIDVPAADYTAYNAIVASASALVEADYTEESWAVLQAALDVDVSGLNVLGQAQINAATNAIVTAINTLEEAQTAIVLGDANGDGEFDGNDLIIACQVNAGIVGSSDDIVAILDVNGSGEFDGNDLIILCQYNAGIINVWPVDAQ